MNPEINKKMRAIERKCDNKQPEHYPDYCHRAVTDILSLLNLILEDLDENLAKKEKAIDDLELIDRFVKLEDIMA